MSGIYIPNMEMPREKKTTLTIFPDGRVYENHGERLWGHGKDCIPWKAIYVPPHGRLIEKHAVFKLISSFPEIDKLLTVEFMKALYNLPTIIPADTSMKDGDANG